MVTSVGQWWTETRKPSVEEVANHLAALAWMGLHHLPKNPDAHLADVSARGDPGAEKVAIPRTGDAPGVVQRATGRSRELTS